MTFPRRSRLGGFRGVPVLVPVRASPVLKERKQKLKAIFSRRPPLGVCLFLPLFAVSRQFSQRPSCHLAFFPLSSFSCSRLLSPLATPCLLLLVLNSS